RHEAATACQIGASSVLPGVTGPSPPARRFAHWRAGAVRAELLQEGRLVNRARMWAVALVASLGMAAPLAGPPSRAAAADCHAVCQAWQQQRQDALPRTGFYQPPDPLPWGAPGQLIREQLTSDYRVQGSPVTATRILYHSRTAAGGDVAASGVVLLPAGTPPAGGWPVVVDAHGTSGVGRDCAPSLMRDLYHGNQMLQFVSRGWAVVAPD